MTIFVHEKFKLDYFGEVEHYQSSLRENLIQYLASLYLYFALKLCIHEVFISFLSCFFYHTEFMHELSFFLNKIDWFIKWTNFMLKMHWLINLSVTILISHHFINKINKPSIDIKGNLKYNEQFSDHMLNWIPLFST